MILGNREDSPPHLHEAPGANGGSHLLGVDAAGREVSADSPPALGVLVVEVLLRARFGEERKHAQGDEGRTRGVAAYFRGGRRLISRVNPSFASRCARSTVISSMDLDRFPRPARWAFAARVTSASAARSSSGIMRGSHRSGSHPTLLPFRPLHVYGLPRPHRPGRRVRMKVRATLSPSCSRATDLRSILKKRGESASAPEHRRKHEHPGRGRDLVFTALKIRVSSLIL